MNLAYYIKSAVAALRQGLDFSGRMSRCRFWSAFLVLSLVGVAIGLVDVAMGTYNPFEPFELGPLLSTYWVVTILPSYAAASRRLHDAGSSGWLSLIVLVPIVGYFVWLVLLGRPGTPGPNQFGESPTADMNSVGTFTSAT